VVLGIGADGDGVRLERLERFCQALVTRQAGEFLVKIFADRGLVGAEAHELEAVGRAIGARVAHAHRAESDDEDALAHNDVRIVSLRQFDLSIGAGACAIDSPSLDGRPSGHPLDRG
jgi:hypothetical protein